MRSWHLLITNWNRGSVHVAPLDRFGNEWKMGWKTALELECFGKQCLSLSKETTQSKFLLDPLISLLININTVIPIDNHEVLLNLLAAVGKDFTKHWKIPAALTEQEWLGKQYWN